MEPMFTPWRLRYLTAERQTGTCLFCATAATGEDRAALVLHRGAAAFVMLNLYPYNNGHLMVVSRRHLARLSEASAEERREIIDLAAWSESILERSYRCEGMNLGLNLGRAAGAGVEGHLHLHVVPRWSGDTNFAAVLAGARIIPETPQETYERLKPCFDGEAPPRSGA
jgi:ATP adenylyltransferase